MATSHETNQLDSKEIERRMTYGLHKALRTPAKTHAASTGKRVVSQEK